MKAKFLLALAALPLRNNEAFVPPVHPAAGGFHPDLAPQAPGRVPVARGGSTQSAMVELLNNLPFADSKPAVMVRCPGRGTTPTSARPEEPPPAAKLIARPNHETTPLVFNVAPPAGRASVETTLKLTGQIYDPEFVAAAANTAAGDALDAKLVSQLTTDPSQSYIVPRYVTDQAMVTRSTELGPDGAPYMHSRVTFRGTVITDGDDRKVDFVSHRPQRVSLPLGSNSGDKVDIGAGWLERYNEHRESIRATLDADREAANSLGIPHVTTFSGHSLGGAVSIVAAMDEASRMQQAGAPGATEERGSSVRVIAVSPARPGFRRAFDDKLLALQEEGQLQGVQIRHSWDPVSSVPGGAHEPLLPLVEVEGVAPTPLQALDNHDLNILTDRLGKVMDHEAKV